MINILLVILVLGLFGSISWFLWKSGFLSQAEKPESLIDRPVMDAKERRAIMKRLRRWREEGKLTREEFEHVTALCQSEWDGDGEAEADEVNSPIL